MSGSVPDVYLIRLCVCCATCGGTDVSRDAWAKWNVAAQQWELGEVFDHAYCHGCDATTTLQYEEITVAGAVT